MTSDTVHGIQPGNSPLIISIPHLGTAIPDALRDQYTPEALTVVDTDWHLDRVYSFAQELGATLITAKISRYVIDLNRPASGESLYPGMVTTSLCPTEAFRGGPVYLEGCAPDDAEIDRRVSEYWKPYHAVLQQEIARLQASHANILLWEAHSIASVLPRLFSGKLPDLNFGTSDGSSCGDKVIAGALDAVRGGKYNWVLNGRFKGGFITRRYGAPADGVHAIQLEMCQSLYMDEEAPFDWLPELAQDVVPVVRASVQGALARVEQMNSVAGKQRADILAG